MQVIGDCRGGASWALKAHQPISAMPETVAASSKSPLPGPRSPRCQVKMCLSCLARKYLNSTYKEREGNTQKCLMRDYPGGPLIKTSPSKAGGASSIPDQKAKIPHASGPKSTKGKNRSNIVTNSIKTFKMVHTKKKKKNPIVKWPMRKKFTHPQAIL